MSSPTLYELTPIMKEVLERGGTLKLKPRGISMYPFIRDNRDEIYLCKTESSLQKRGVYLFERLDGKMVLHRLIKVRKDGLVFRGDNQIRSENKISKMQVIARVVQVKRGNRFIKSNSLSFRVYSSVALPYCFVRRVIHKTFFKLIKR